MSTWKTATLIKADWTAKDIRALRFQIDDWVRHTPGQFCEIRLTAPDGYQAQRSYSITSAPDDEGVYEFAVQILPDGEVSSYLGIINVGEQVEIKGPLGRYFVWDENSKRPAILIGGGSGMAPLVSMARAHNNLLLLASIRSLEDMMYKEELMKLAESHDELTLKIALTREAPEDWSGIRGRISKEILMKELSEFIGLNPIFYICGSNGFVDSIAMTLVEIGFDAGEIRTERFG